MNTQQIKYVLIGGGAASLAAARAIREMDAEGALTLIAQENIRPYRRPPLSKEFLRREMDRNALFIEAPVWFEAHRIKLRTGCRAAQLDVNRAAVLLDTGESISYDRLLLATGMAPARVDAPGANLPNLYYLRTLEDALHVHHAIEKSQAEGRLHRAGKRGVAAVIGGGTLGVEVAASLAQLDLRVDLICGGAHPWDKFAGDVAGKALVAHLESHGVCVHANSRPARFEGDGRVQRVALTDGRIIDCDFAIAAVGGVPHKELLRNTPIASEKAILTDALGQTNVPGVYAAGDCAAIFDPRFGKHRILDHWDGALATGRLAGRNMAGANEPWSDVGHFSSAALGASLDVWGEAKAVDRRIARTERGGAGELPSVIEVGVSADGRVSQILAFGKSASGEFWRSLVENRASVVGKEEAMKDPSAPWSDAF